MKQHSPTSADGANAWRLPGEFEAQAATLVAWPHANTDWASRLDAIRREIGHLVEVLLQYQPVILLMDPADKDPLPPALVGHDNLHVAAIGFDDTWCRDFGPIGMVRNNRRKFLDFRFSAWGKDYANTKDDQVTSQLMALPEISRWIGPSDQIEIDFVLEGGAIESNGNGCVLVNWHCLETRHPGLDREVLRSKLQQHLGTTTIAGIDIAPHPGDDTDGHIDTLARFIGPNTLVVQSLSDSVAHASLVAQIEAIEPRTLGSSTEPPQIVYLPHPTHHTGLPLNYVNFVLLNGACLVPTYQLPTDELALAIIAKALPDRDVIGIESSVLITQFGGPHCATMHIPAPNQKPSGSSFHD